ncbi:MAG: glycosyltransferase family 4 protein [Exilispira sp.]|jgi:glycosyltransferase involved in cell wall biosynthesis|nr:glycosyltransferase family 4 protein [Exilispira sp.]
MKKIALIVLNNFTNDIRVYKECKTLNQVGYDSIVVALHEDRLKEYEDINGVKVHRIKLKTRKWLKYKPIQFIKYLEFIYRFIKKYKSFDIFHCNDLNALPIGVVIKKLFNNKAKIVYDAHEYEIERNGISKIEKKIYKILEKCLLKYVDSVITVSESIANEYTKIYKINKPFVVYNVPYYQKVSKKNIFREKFNIEVNQKIFLYQGGLSKGRGIEILLEAFYKIYKDKDKYENIPVIIFLGSGYLENVIIQNSQICNNIYFHQAVAPDMLLDYTSSADCGICLYENICLNHNFALPNKIFEYLMAEIPFITSNTFEIGKLIKEYNVGLICKENNVEELIEKINLFINLNPNIYYNEIIKIKKQYNWEKQEDLLINIYKELK